MHTAVRKLFLIVIILSLTLTGISPRNAKGETIKIEFYVGAVTAIVNGSVVKLDVPIIIDKSCNRTLVPLRFVAESFGAKVKWTPKTKEISITLSGKTIKLWIGRKEAVINNNTVKMDCTPKILFSRTIVPIRFISEAFGANVKWDAKTRKITILFEKASVPTENNKIVKADPNAVSISTKTVKISGETKKVVFYIVKINLKGKNVTIAPYLTGGGLHTADSASSFEKKIKPIAMVNGGTFDLTYFIPTGDIVRNGIPQFIRNDGYEYKETMGITENKTPFFADGATKYTVILDGKEYPLTSVNGMWHGMVKLYTNWYKTPLNILENEVLLIVKNNKILSEKSGTTFYPATMDDNEYALLLPKGLANTPLKSAYIKITINGKDYSGGTFVKCGPLLLKDGHAYLDYSRYAYLNRTQKKGARSVLAFDENNDMYFIFTPTPVRLNYGDLSVALEKLGFLSYAISLDGGGSTLLYYKGKYIARPGRKIVSVIAVPPEIPSGNP